MNLVLPTDWMTSSRAGASTLSISLLHMVILLSVRFVWKFHNHRNIYYAFWSLIPPPLFWDSNFSRLISLRAGGAKFMTKKDAFFKAFSPFFNVIFLLFFPNSPAGVVGYKLYWSSYWAKNCSTFLVFLHFLLPPFPLLFPPLPLGLQPCPPFLCLKEKVEHKWIFWYMASPQPKVRFWSDICFYVSDNDNFYEHKVYKYFVHKSSHNLGQQMKNHYNPNLWTKKDLIEINTQSRQLDGGSCIFSNFRRGMW